MPYLVFKLKNYDIISYYEKLIELISFVSSGEMLMQRLKNSLSPLAAGYGLAKALDNRQVIKRLREILTLVKNDRQFRAFHEHETDSLPEFYQRKYELLLGLHSGLISREERKPILSSQKIIEAQRVKDLADEEILELAKEKARKEAYQARENEIARDQEARRLKNSR
jgi:hypothetical protein